MSEQVTTVTELPAKKTRPSLWNAKTKKVAIYGSIVVIAAIAVKVLCNKKEESLTEDPAPTTEPTPEA